MVVVCIQNDEEEKKLMFVCFDSCKKEKKNEEFFDVKYLKISKKLFINKNY